MFDLFHFVEAGQLVDFDLYQSVVGLHVMFPVFGAGIFYGGIDAGQLVDVRIVVVCALQYGHETAQCRDVCCFVLFLYFLYQDFCFKGAEDFFTGFAFGTDQG